MLCDCIGCTPSAACASRAATASPRSDDGGGRSVGPIDIEAAVNKEGGGTTNERAGMPEGKRKDSNQIQSDPRQGILPLLLEPSFHGTALPSNRTGGSEF